MSPPDEAVDRFRGSLARLAGGDFPKEGRLGLAVSGGPDSLAMALLAGAAMPGRVVAATVDHGFNPDGAAWARQAGEACATLGMPHDILTVDWLGDAPTVNRQAEAREARYALLADWAARHGIAYVATAHHLDDQAETLLMRLARGAGVSGLAGIRARRPLAIRDGQPIWLVRPLLDWRRHELEALVSEAGLTAVDDPANHDPAHDRTRVRAFLNADATWPDRHRLAASADHLADAEDALLWSTGRLLAERWDDQARTLNIEGLPRDYRRRALDVLLRDMGEEPRGDALARALALLDRGEVAMLGATLVRPGRNGWQFEPAPPRRTG